MAERRRAKSEKSQAFRLFRFRCFSGFIQVKGNGNKQIRVGAPRALRGVGIKAEEDNELRCLFFMPCILAHWHVKCKSVSCPFHPVYSPRGSAFRASRDGAFPWRSACFSVLRLSFSDFSPSVFRPPSAVSLSALRLSPTKKQRPENRPLSIENSGHQMRVRVPTIWVMNRAASSPSSQNTISTKSLPSSMMMVQV